MRKKLIKEKNISGKEHCDICGESHYLDVHHINGRKIKNAESASNKASVCPNCHRSIHMGDIIIEKWALTSNGYQLLWHYKNEEGVIGHHDLPHIIKRH